jgi:hypothetical protein
VRQTSEGDISYTEAAQQIIKKDGINGLLFRGLETKLITNGIQSIMFSILWRHFEAQLNAKKKTA